ncbi:unnamed protein product [Musa acuminata subsp. burmannicoides]
MLHNQTFNLDQVAFATEGIKDAEQTMSALKSANKELKGMMKIVNTSDIDSMQDEMMDLSTEIQESLGRSHNVANDIDEEELMGGMHDICVIQCIQFYLLVWIINAELDALESDMGAKMESDAIPSYLQPDTETDLDAKLNLPVAPTSNAAAMPNRARQQTEDELGLPAVPQSFYTQLKEHCSQNGKTKENPTVTISVRTDGTSSASSSRRWRQTDRARKPSQRALRYMARISMQRPRILQPSDPGS